MTMFTKKENAAHDIIMRRMGDLMTLGDFLVKHRQYIKKLASFTTRKGKKAEKDFLDLLTSFHLKWLDGPVPFKQLPTVLANVQDEITGNTSTPFSRMNPAKKR
jgi:hypothetical protein